MFTGNSFTLVGLGDDELGSGELVPQAPVDRTSLPGKGKQS